MSLFEANERENYLRFLCFCETSKNLRFLKRILSDFSWVLNENDSKTDFEFLRKVSYMFFLRQISQTHFKIFNKFFWSVLKKLFHAMKTTRTINKAMMNLTNGRYDRISTFKLRFLLKMLFRNMSLQVGCPFTDFSRAHARFLTFCPASGRVAQKPIFQDFSRSRQISRIFFKFLRITRTIQKSWKRCRRRQNIKKTVA